MAGLTDDAALIDQHCHGVVTTDLDRLAFEALLTEATRATPDRSRFDSMLGLAVRRWCAPVLGLPAHAEADEYLERRAELGWWEASTRLLRAAGVTDWLVDTGFTPVTLTGVPEVAELAAGTAHEIVRLETLAERVAEAGGSAEEFAADLETELHRAAAGAVGLKSVAAYRAGLDLPARPPSPAALAAAVGRWFAVGGRLVDPLVIGWLVHLGVRVGAEFGLPLQLHTGFGDDDLRLHQADPSLLTDFLTATRDSGTTVVLLHCWPYHRQAAYLAHVFGHVVVDVGLAVPHVGARSGAVLAELLELAPFGAVCFSSDGYGLPELHFLGALLWRRELGRLLDAWIADDVLTCADAERLVASVARDNALRVYTRMPE
ncbi:hypothetical protein LX15_000568 [Streptoalloteichus tenebrarius]|uniref:Amidohydrolase-related domain-containing protein n=1 Tax=Streptoalloteichus tenebrarius (strain ATCC 17920 / DSM 40477 / JCM 4838 / CBS 697.72 / NBRC 16177 / NCIMB 11028 / NRRL B-12390 / A12253. 1 / ISP 5477) TaxID=1933 RepID=A0ABT1HMZ8_STRSD|nr:amidohydrolase family protein [Streptoalloteichus tenebrarius]MCP2256885.1 hypothetical protein [Streptoalloteichus tenebrarius]BFF00208.1 amidohydrolase family protein [Streptoalloteichus tenebrarius]